MQEDNADRTGQKTPSKGMLTVREAATATGLSVFTLDQYRTLRKRGVVRGPDFVRCGRSVFYPSEAVDAFLAKREG